MLRSCSFLIGCLLVRRGSIITEEEVAERVDVSSWSRAIIGNQQTSKIGVECSLGSLWSVIPGAKAKQWFRGQSGQHNGTPLPREENRGTGGQGRGKTAGEIILVTSFLLDIFKKLTWLKT